jgi:hypothetical protein
VDVAAGKGVGFGGAIGDADGFGDVIPDGPVDSVAADDPGDGDGAVAQVATSTTERTSDAIDRAIPGCLRDTWDVRVARLLRVT